MAQTGAHLGLHLPGSSSSTREPPAGQTPPSPPSTQQPSAARPTAPAAGLHPHTAPTQTRATTQTHPGPATATPVDRELFRRQQDEITRLREQVARLASNQPLAAQPTQLRTQAAPAGNDNESVGPDAPARQQGPQRTLFLEDAAAEHARAQLVAKTAEETALKKTSLPDIIPGFKASPLSLGEYALSSYTAARRMGTPLHEVTATLYCWAEGPLRTDQAGGHVYIEKARGPRGII
ncbi:hypothetical protein L208DRAFT_815420 [Tricholoma matsutake]|nr:hypothetical protein L208DRAFT_815420 [Tricholoma matsutake 945]